MITTVVHSNSYVCSGVNKTFVLPICNIFANKKVGCALSNSMFLHYKTLRIFQALIKSHCQTRCLTFDSLTIEHESVSILNFGYG